MLSLRTFRNFISLEPVTFAMSFGVALLLGAEVTTDLLLHKICIHELSYPESICGNLNKTSDIFNEVQRRGNDFQMVTGWLGSGPAIVYSLFVGSLADDFGYKPFLLGPLIGMLIGDIAMLLNCIFIDVFPLEVFYFENGWALFGGGAIFFFGVYGHGTMITQPDSRASTLGRYDGFYILGKISGTFLSPIILKQLSAVYNYAFKIGCTLTAVIYVIVMVKPPPKPAAKSDKKKMTFKTLFKPLIHMFKALFTKRPNKLHWIIAVQYFLYASYCYSNEEEVMRYLYLQKSVGVTGTDYAYLTVFTTLINSFGLLVLLPILSHKFKLHDASIQTLCLAVECIGLYAFVFSINLWQVYVSNGIMELLSWCKFGLIRSLISKCVQSDETGKLFSIMAIMAAILHFAGGAAYRQLYSATLDTFPASEILMKGILFTFGGVLSLMVFQQKWRIESWNKSKLEPAGNGENCDDVKEAQNDEVEYTEDPKRGDDKAPQNDCVKELPQKYDDTFIYNLQV